MYGNASAERGYYTPKDSVEGEREMTKTVYCGNEGCRDYEVEHEAEVLVSYSGTYGVATYTCPSCSTENQHEWDNLDEFDFGFDPDIREDK